MNFGASSARNRESIIIHSLSSIAIETEERLSRSGYQALRGVSCVVGDGVLYLHGSLPSHYLKQVAQEIATGARGQCEVINRIIVSNLVRDEREGRETLVQEPST